MYLWRPSIREYFVGNSTTGPVTEVDMSWLLPLGEGSTEFTNNSPESGNGTPESVSIECYTIDLKGSRSSDPFSFFLTGSTFSARKVLD